MTNPEKMSPEEKAALDKLNDILSRHKVTVFDEAEVKIIKAMIDTYVAFTALGRFASFARNVVIWIAAMAAAFYAFNEWVVRYVQKAVTP